MKNYKRAERRWKAKCKFEKRIKLWAPLNRSQNFISRDRRLYQLSGEELRDKIREGEYWKFLRWTSTPCSCSMCSYPKYERTPKGKINRQIWDEISDNFDNGLVV